MEEGIVNPEDGVQFARDLRRIREAVGLKVAELSNTTRIPEGVLRAFEENALFDHPVFNPVYLRSFVKTYASAIGISADDALAGLEQSLAGMYRGHLGRDFFGEVQRSETPTPAADTVQRTGNEVPETPPDPVPVTISSAPIAEHRLTSIVTTTPGMVVRPSIVRRVFAVATTLGILLLAALIVRSLIGSTDVRGTDGSPGDALHSGSDSATGPEIASTRSAERTDLTPVPARKSLPTDSVIVLVHPIDGPVRGIRIRLDRGIRRPYWIESDSVLELAMAERMIIEDHNGAVAISVPVINYRSEPLTPGAPFVLSRQTLDQFLNSTAGSQAGQNSD